MKTEFVPFDLKNMDKALSFKTEGGNAVTQVTHYTGVCKAAFNSGSIFSVIGVVDGELKVFTENGRVLGSSYDTLLMEVEVEVTYPCFCWVNDSYEQYAKVRLVETHSVDCYIDHEGASWSLAVPLTDEELLEYCNIRLSKG